MKFILKCSTCGQEFGHFNEWFSHNQVCPKCGKNRVEALYFEPYEKLLELIKNRARTDQSLWHYFDFLPLNNRQNIVSTPEKTIGIDRWSFLEDLALEFGIKCKVHVFRNDEHYATGTFKDPGASLAASVLKENAIESYIVASTGNVANAFAYYMAKAGVNLHAFISEDALPLNGAGVSCYGQKVFRVNHDYHTAKQIASEFSKRYGILMTCGNVDPLRVEAKRTMVFEWLRELNEFPSVYIQALSGGTGPIAIDKAIRELKPLDLVKSNPRFLMVQPDGCAPMAQAWKQAEMNGFPEGWQHNYPILVQPKTQVPTLATGNPATYPLVSQLVKDSGGCIIDISEQRLVDITRWIAYESIVAIGPASATAVAGFIKSLKNKLIKDGDVVLLNIGEGQRRAPELLKEMNYTEVLVNSIEDCKPFNRAKLGAQLREKAIAD